MKRNAKKFVVLALALCVAAGAIWLCIPYEENHVGYLEPEYGAVTVNKLAEKAPIVAVVTYLGDDKTIALKDRGPIPATVGKVQVEEVLQGTLTEEVIPICFYGGTISDKELYEGMEDEPPNRGIIAAIFRFKHRKDTTTLKFDSMVDAKEGQRYLLFTGKDPENDYYTVIADAYGMCPLDENTEAYYKETFFTGGK